MLNNPLEDEFYHNGYVCVYERNESIMDLIENNRRENSHHLLSFAEEAELSQPITVDDLKAATIQIKRKLSLFKQKNGNFVPPYKFSHRVLDEEPSVPSLKDLDRGLLAVVHDPNSDCEDHSSTPLYYLPLLRTNSEILKDFRRLVMINISGGLRAAFEFNKRLLQNDCGKRLEMAFPSLPRQTQKNLLLRYNKLRKVQDHLEEFIDGQKRRFRRTYSNMDTCSSVCRDISYRSSIPTYFSRYVFLLFNYHVHSFDLFAMSCQETCQKILDFNLEVNDFLLLLDTFKSK